jgi:glycine cleavage system P protein (glycine dehydrogenase) subunit 2
MLIFEQSSESRAANGQFPQQKIELNDISEQFLRTNLPRLPQCSELQVVRHYTKLSQLNFSIDTQFYPLGSCTMKYNPKGVHVSASHPSFLNRHPLATEKVSQGYLKLLYELQSYISTITGMEGVSLTPMAGSQGELAGVAMIKAYHQSRGESHRNEMLIPDAAHGTNPASAVMCGFKVIEVPTAPCGDVDIDALKQKIGPNTAGIMLTNPSTLGVFMRHIKQVANIIHQAGGLLYYDGANLNAILGKVKPGDMGFDVMHLNLHKTFATPHGGGGPGSGPIAVGERLLPFLPLPTVLKENNSYRWAQKADLPKSIGRLSCYMGNAGILLRAYFYMRLLGREGMHKVSEFATLNANYLMTALDKAGFKLAYPQRRASHEFIISLNPFKKAYNVNAMDFAKRLLDYGYHAPTTYFPLLIPECFLIEPTETECKQEMDGFIAAMKAIKHEAEVNAELLSNAPHSMPVKRLDDVKAARELDLTYYQE